jgi:hypothetical protein
LIAVTQNVYERTHGRRRCDGRSRRRYRIWLHLLPEDQDERNGWTALAAGVLDLPDAEGRQKQSSEHVATSNGVEGRHRF